MLHRFLETIQIGDVQSLLAASGKYGADYVILEKIGKSSPLFDLFEHPENYPEFKQLGVMGDNHILAIKPNP